MTKEKPEKISLKSLDAKLDAKVGALDVKVDVLGKRMDEFGESQRKMGVLMEVIDGKLSLMLEGYVGHDARIVRLEEKMERSA